METSLKIRTWINLELDSFPEYETFMSFVDNFLGFNSDSHLHKFTLHYADYDEPENNIIARWINTVLTRKVEHLDLVDNSPMSWNLQVPLTLYNCETLVSLKLDGVILASPPKFVVSLPSLKVMDLTIVHYENSLTLETLISGCPALERLLIERSYSDNIQVLRVCSQSLLSFTHVADGSECLVEDLVVVIDAPRLEYLKINDSRTASFVLKNSSSLVEVCIDTMFDLELFDPNYLPKRTMIRNFLFGISRVKDMTIASDTLEVIYDYSRCESLPLFPNLSFLRVEFTDYNWEMLPIFLARCPNLKSLVVGRNEIPGEEGNDIISGSRCLLPSLEYVEIERPLKGEAKEMKLVSYLLENSTILKKVTLGYDDSIKEKESTIFRELLTIPRLSSLCQVVVL